MNDPIEPSPGVVSSSQAKNPKTLSHQSSSDLHRPRTLYLVRHGEAVHNVLEAKAQAQAKLEAQSMNLSEEETQARMEEARKAVLQDTSLRDAALTDKGREQAKECGRRLQKFIDEGLAPPPSEAMVSPLSRTLETCQLILDAVNADIKAHIRPELQERQTQYPPDTPRKRNSLLRSSLFRYTLCNDRFIIDHIEQVSPEAVEDECQTRESKEKLRIRASHLFNLLMEMTHRHVLIVSHKGYLRELERGLLGLEDSPLFGNAEVRVYRVEFTRGERKLKSLERLA